MNRRYVLFAVVLAVLAAAVAVTFLLPRDDGKVDEVSRTEPARTKIVINEAVRTLLYLPLYHAQHAGYLANQGIDAEIITGGTATNSVAALLSGEAHFAQADPMYAPISRTQGSDVKVVAQVVGRIAIWGLTRSSDPQAWSKVEVRGKKIATQPRPMTAYVYARKAITDLGLDPDTDVTLSEHQPGSEIVPLLRDTTDYAFTLEPNVSRAINDGARIVVSFPNSLGDQVFTGLMTTDRYLRENRATAVAVATAYQQALQDIHANPTSAVASAISFFPQLDAGTVTAAINRMIREQVFPRSIEISDESWERAVRVRVAAGDLKTFASRIDNCDLDLMREAVSKAQLRLRQAPAVQ